MPTMTPSAEQETQERVAPKPEPRLDIQGLRAVAVLVVVANHLFQWPMGGFIGVDVFFVISGYLITSLLLREHQRTGRVSFADFYARRIRRVVPAAVAVLIFVGGLAVPIYGTTRGWEIIKDAVWSLLFAANWRFYREDTDYFAQGQAPSPLQHYWSLGVEEQFYLVWPWLLLIVLGIASRRLGLGRTASLALLALAMAVVTAASFLFAVAQTENNVAAAYFSSFTRAWELGVGGLLAVSAGIWRRLPAFLAILLSWVGLAGIVASLALVAEDRGFPAPWAALPVLSTALVILAGEGHSLRWSTPLLTNPVAVKIGDWSYSLYLWHFPAVILPLAYLDGSSVTYYALAMVAMTVLSLASFYWVEEPIRSSNWLKGSWIGPAGSVLGQSAVKVAFTAALAWVVLCMSIVAVQQPKTPVLSASSFGIANPTSGEGETPTPGCLGAVVMTGEPCAPLETDQVFPGPQKVYTDLGNSYDCFIEFETDFESCSYGHPDSAMRIALVGDSHAAALIPGLSRQATAQSWALDTYVGQGCVWGYPDRCAAMGEIDVAVKNGAYDAILVTQIRSVFTPDRDDALRQMADAWQAGSDTGARIIGIGDTPSASDDAIQCLTRSNVTAESECLTSTSSAFARPDLIQEVAGLVPDARYVDVTDLFCVDGQCPGIIGNVQVYRDTLSHLSATFSVSLGPYLAQRIAAELPRQTRRNRT